MKWSHGNRFLVQDHLRLGVLLFLCRLLMCNLDATHFKVKRCLGCYAEPHIVDDWVLDVISVR